MDVVSYVLNVFTVYLTGRSASDSIGSIPRALRIPFVPYVYRRDDNMRTFARLRAYTLRSSWDADKREEDTGHERFERLVNRIR